MLVRFSVSNFLSFKNLKSLDLAVSAITEYIDFNTFETSITDLKLLKSLIIYGPNSSGKSNMFKAMNFMRWFMLNSFKDLQASEEIDVESFNLSTQTTGKPSFFEIELLVKDVKYRYGFRADRSKVYEEHLYFTRKIKEYPLFVRKKQKITVESKFALPSEVVSLTRENALFLSLAAQFNNEISKSILNEISNFKFISGYRDENHIDFTVSMLEDKKYGHIVKDFILSADLGFTDIQTEKFKFTEKMLAKTKIPNELKKLILKGNKDSYQINTSHQVFDENNKPTQTILMGLMQNESLGTQKYFSLAGPIISTIINGGVLVIDEFSSRMHPKLSESIMRLFNSTTNNPNNAQFLFATHNTRFINKASNIFRRDQMILFKKDQYGATDVKSLFDLRIRKDASFEKEYLLGKYEAVPNIDISRQLQLPFKHP